MVAVETVQSGRHPNCAAGAYLMVDRSARNYLFVADAQSRSFSERRRALATHAIPGNNGPDEQF
jgi:hypothetical protein